MQAAESIEMAIGKWFLIFLMFTLRYSLSVVTPPDAAMFVLGDSSVDCGENNPLNGFLHQNLSRFPCNGSDTTLLPQLLGTLSLSSSHVELFIVVSFSENENAAKKMGFPYSTPFYSQNGSIKGIIDGLNFGSAEATILYRYSGSLSYQSLNQQLRQAFETIQLLELQLGEETANNFIRSSIFYLSFGKDDLTDFFYNKSLGHSSEEFTDILVHQMRNAITSLYASNVRKVICAGVLPLGCAPHVLRNITRKQGCLQELNEVVLYYNKRLEESIVAIDAELVDARLVFCDVYQPVMDFINNPNKYGIEDVRNACCGGVSGCTSTEMACREASTHVWWDLYNPTPAINSLLAHSAWSLSSICRPFSLKHLLLSSSSP
ncbi:hypothetical protein C2S51_024552 [Perilla frutescens var. frutescens]|nr:hypothetical protein C2S51_024552 [Perilla frutescens var. frutescens]